MNMFRIFWRGAVTLGITLVAVRYAPAQERDSAMPRVENAHIEQRALAGPLSAEMKGQIEQSAQARWIGYALPQIANDREICCQNYSGSWGNGNCGICRLESGDHDLNMTISFRDAPPPVEARQAVPGQHLRPMGV